MSASPAGGPVAAANSSLAPQAGTAATGSSKRGSVVEKDGTGRVAGGSSKKGDKAAEEALAREVAAAAALALIPASSQPPSSTSQTNLFHCTVHSAPFSLLVNSNA